MWKPIDALVCLILQFFYRTVTSGYKAEIKTIQFYAGKIPF